MTSNPGENSHNYDHNHKVLKYDDDSAHDYDEMGRYALMSEALKELLIEKNVVSANEVREYLDFMDSRGEHVGAEIIAKAWASPDFKKRLMTDGTATVAELGVPMAGAELIVVENTRRMFITLSCARSAPAIHALSSDCRRIGTKAKFTGLVQFMNRAPFCESLEPFWPIMSVYGCMTVMLTCAIW